MSKQVMGDRPASESNQPGESADARLGEIYSLTNEIVDLFYTQIFSYGGISTPSGVCKAFSDIIERHWNLCCIVIYLRGDDGEFSEVAVKGDDHLDEAKAREIGGLMVEALGHEGHELQFWPDREAGDVTEDEKRVRRALSDAGMRAGMIVPIRTHHTMVGALAVITPFADRLREALDGIRFIAAPIIIAVGNARRTAAMSEQHQRIGHLVEELQQRSDALEEANRELRRVAVYRSLFLSRMSHELRTPLTSVLGFAEILLEHESLTPSQRRFCEKIQSSGHQLRTSLNQLVDLSRLEAGQTELFLHEFSLREALRESCAAVARQAQKQGAKLVCSSTLEEFPTIVSDEGKLRQVLYNFLAYAINRSPAGGHVTVGARSITPSAFQISIADEGESLTDTSHIFEPIDIEAPTERATSMNELGLAIARRLIDILGGTVALESPTPHGLRVLIELPVRPDSNGQWSAVGSK
jgi:signal transduction histidine kinase